jgi:hypothetical protein
MNSTRSRKNRLFVLSNSIAGKVLDLGSISHGYFVAWDESSDQYIHVNASTLVTYEILATNGDVGSEAGQLAKGDHDHEVGDLVLLFDNALI